MEPLAIKLQQSVRPVVIEDTVNGGTKEYELREMKASERDKYLTQVAARCRVTAEGNLGSMEKFDGHEADLIIKCLWDKEAKRFVTRDDIKDWPASLSGIVYEAAFELNKIKKEALAKKD